MLTPRRLTYLWDIYSLRTNRSRVGFFGDPREEPTEKKGKERRTRKGALVGSVGDVQKEGKAIAVLLLFLNGQ